MTGQILDILTAIFGPLLLIPTLGPLLRWLARCNERPDS